jgi:EpsI family protein
VGELERLPENIGDWIGEPRSLDERVAEATGTDHQVYRTYRHPDGRAVEFYLGYGVRIRDLAPHRPDVCYPSNGWTQIAFSIEDVKAQSPFEAQFFLFEKSGLGRSQIAVLYYYVVDGQVVHDMQTLRQQLSQSSTDLRYVAQVQIAAVVSGSTQRAREAIDAFATKVAEPLNKMLTDVVNEAIESEPES